MDRDPVSFKLLLQIFSVTLSLLTCCFDITKGTRTSHHSIAHVCSRDQLELTCSTTERIHEWSFSWIPNTRALSSMSRSHQASYLIDNVNSVILNFTRITAQNMLPLVSRLLISPVVDALNGTSVNCTDSESPETQSTMIIVISNEDITWQNNVLVETTTVVTSEVFESSNVTVTLEWTQVNSLYTYHVIIVPQVEQKHNGSTQVQFTALYNTHYNIYVVAEHPCGQNNVTTFKELYYAKCGNPATESEYYDDSILIMGYSELALEGSTISLSCPSGLVLTGPSTLTCMDSGEWGPHLKGFKCLPLTCTCNRTNVTETLFSERLSSDINIAVASSVTVFVTTSVLFFIIGCLCGHFCRKKKLKQDCGVVPSLVETSAAVYDNVTVIQNNTDPQELELQENIAYGPI